jgi:ATP-binding cassette subfamily B protein
VRRLPLATLRAAVGFVPQEPFLFSTTVRANVALGLADDHDPRVEAAAEVAQLTRDVRDFPAGFDTPVGERGITLSGGQKQRTAIARALAVDPRDPRPRRRLLLRRHGRRRRQILNGPAHRLRGRTTFLVSHRVSTVKEADRIVVLREGRIVESGTHESPRGGGGFYADLHRRQLLESEVETA